ncbi:hypothetical protein BDZ45DRAFT_363472 [Acephala macrosclerotiorum]|nr:hypothetical protein BDZ45DRAFT_363472 [Acephala macrosclerotiorum]
MVSWINSKAPLYFATSSSSSSFSFFFLAFSLARPGLSTFIITERPVRWFSQCGESASSILRKTNLFYGMRLSNRSGCDTEVTTNNEALDSLMHCAPNACLPSCSHIQSPDTATPMDCSRCFHGWARL